MRLVDGDALSKETGKLWSEMPDGEELSKELMKAINHTPTVDAIPVKHGKWLPVLNGKDDDSNPAFDCSECDAMCRKQYNYCPRCGAKMDLEG